MFLLFATDHVNVLQNEKALEQHWGYSLRLQNDLQMLSIIYIFVAAWVVRSKAATVRYFGYVQLIYYTWYIATNIY